MYDYEKLGVFYLGKGVNPENGEVGDDFVMYDSKDLTTHAVIVGMTGSGKTGLGIALLEEAAIDGIPSLIIDPKGDMGNLMLNFPGLQPGDFRPWVEKDEAARKGMTPEEFAANRATTWKEGLADWDQPPERIQKLRDAVDIAIYTPGSDAGLQLTILKSLTAPPPAVVQSTDAMRERVASAVSGLLTLLGFDADPLLSREHILLSNIVDAAWREGRSLDLASLIREIQNPPFNRVGVMDLESIFPAPDRLKLAMTVNNVLASPHFASWTQGEPLDIQRLLYTPEGKPRMAILSIAHLNDAERMFFVTLLLNEMVSWMRAQQGTSSLRAILYMDEVFGYLPPSANPPSKLPMLTLLKQARAFGLGLILATQNPVDLDYKALSNAGTWFLGRLQTERDKLRVLDGLEGATASAGFHFDRRKMEQILSGVGSRVFMLNNVHEDQPVLFQTRWVLSYLRGPLTREQISTLMASRKGTASNTAMAASAPTMAAGKGEERPAPPPMPEQIAAGPPILPPEIKQLFVAAGGNVSKTEQIMYRPALLARGRLHYVDSKSGVDCWVQIARTVPVDEHTLKDPWDDSEKVDGDSLRLDREPLKGARFADPPPDCQRAKAYNGWTSSFKQFLYRAENLKLFHCDELSEYSTPEDKTEGDFRSRLKHAARERRDLEVEKLRKKFASKVATLEERIRKAQQRVEVEQQQAKSAKVSAAMTFGTSILGAIFGRKTLSATNVGRAATSMRSASRASEQSGDVGRAQENLESLQQDLESLNAEIESQVQDLEQTLDVDSLTIEPCDIRPRKTDIMVEDVALLWLPYRLADGLAEPAFELRTV